MFGKNRLQNINQPRRSSSQCPQKRRVKRYNRRQVQSTGFPDAIRGSANALGTNIKRLTGATLLQITVEFKERFIHQFTLETGGD
jgi:hypothetical protein